MGAPLLSLEALRSRLELTQTGLGAGGAGRDGARAQLEASLAKLTRGGEALRSSPALRLGIPALDGALAGGGLPTGGVVEVTSSLGLAKATSLALAACAAAQAGASEPGEWGQREKRWCAWIDPAGTLYAPAVAAAGVDLARLLVVRPRPEDVVRAAVRLAESRVFALVVVDAAAAAGAATSGGAAPKARRAAGPRAAPELPGVLHPHTARRLALATEGSARTVLLLTDRSAQGASFQAPLPVALRLGLERATSERVSVRVLKDRRGLAPPAVEFEEGELLRRAS